MAGSAIGFGSAIAATVLDAVLDAVLGTAWSPVLGLVPLAAVAVGVGSVSTLAGAVASAAQCWGMYSGFVLHGFGELRLDPASRSALLLLLGLGVGASVLGLAVGIVLDRYRARALTSPASPSSTPRLPSTIRTATRWESTNITPPA